MNYYFTTHHRVIGVVTVPCTIDLRLDRSITEHILLILLDGSDCTGKTQLAQRLALALNRQRASLSSLDVYHRGPPTAHPLDEYAEPLLNYRAGNDHNVICDRWHVGEAVYPFVLGRATQLDAAINAWLELFLLSRGALLVHVRRTNEYLDACGRHRDDLYDEIDRIPDVTRAFEHAMASTLLPLIVLDDNDPTNDDVDDIIETAHVQHERVSALNDYVTYIGPRWPSVLLVGDRRGVSGEPIRYGSWPAFAPFPGTSGHYLFSALTREPLRVATHGTLLSQIGVVSANDVDDVHACWNKLGKPRVVALGVEARKTLRRVGVDISHYAPHPQYWARFRHHEPDAYLRRVLGIQTIASVAEAADA
jgi:thymidylate kinase